MNSKKILFGSLVVLAVGGAVFTRAFPVSATSLGDDIDILGNLTTGGSVGIGTTSPTASLDARGTVALGNGWLGNTNHIVDITSVGVKTPLTLMGGDGAMEFWKDTAGNNGLPTKAVAFGMAVPGKAITSDMIFSTYNPWTERLRIVNASGNVGIGTANPTAQLDLTGNTIRIETARTPASSSDACNQGEIAWDANSIYVCVATNTWRKSALVGF